MSSRVHGRGHPPPVVCASTGISHVLFDFDGTLSLIRQGWPEVMVPMFVEVLPPLPGETEDDRRHLAFEDIMRLNGKQTIYQMIQLAERIRERGGQPEEPLWYKHEYLRRLDIRIADRVIGLRKGRSAPTICWFTGRGRCWKTCGGAGLPLYLASGTDLVFVQQEAELLGLDSLLRAPDLRRPGRLQDVLQEDGHRADHPRERDPRRATALLRRRLRRDREHQGGRRPGRRRGQRRGEQRLRPHGPVET